MNKQQQTVKIVRDGMGGFLNPPGDAEHIWSVKGDNFSSSLRYAVNDVWLPKDIRERARELIENSQIEMTEEWVQSCYNYFRHCYSPDGLDKDANNCIVDNNNNQPATHHLAYLHIKKFFPEVEPRMDLIADNGPLGKWSAE